MASASVILPAVAAHRLPLWLADLHAATAVGTTLRFSMPRRAGGATLADLVLGAGFTPASASADTLEATRAHTLADSVGAGMRLLICGLNPSIYSAERGVGFARPGNRFWPSMVAAGLVDEQNAGDPGALLVHHRIGMTDLSKRATATSAELSTDEYQEGTARVERLVGWLRPAALCFVGLEGYRKAVDPKAVAGPLPEGFGGRPAYLMPSTSGLNAHSRPADLVAHLRAAAALAG